MRDIITEDDLLTLAETCTYENYPQFIADKREYASQSGFMMKTKTEEQKARAKQLMAAVQAIKTPGVPREL